MWEHVRQHVTPLYVQVPITLASDGSKKLKRDFGASRRLFDAPLERPRQIGGARNQKKEFCTNVLTRLTMQGGQKQDEGQQ